MAFLVIANTLVYTYVNGYCLSGIVGKMDAYQRAMAFYCASVLLFSFAMVAAINLIHPDLFGIQRRRDIKAYEDSEHAATRFI